jgi:hypothetical protein
MLTRIMTTLMAATLVGGYLAIVLATVLLAAAAPAIAQRSGATLDGRRLGNFGPSAASIGQANPGAQDLARPVDPNQARNLPGAPSTAQTPAAPAVPSTPLLPNSNGPGQMDGR